MDSSGFDDTSAASEPATPAHTAVGSPGTTADFSFDRNQQHLSERLQQTLPDAVLNAVTFDLAKPLSLFLINDDYQTGPLAPAVMQAVIARPAYWAFCWGSGLAAAALILEQPSLVRGRCVLDFGCGSGVVAIAAALAGAGAVIAVDIDPDARLATAVNAELNGVSINVLPGLPCTNDGHLDDSAGVSQAIDLTIVADVLYDRSNLPLLRDLRSLSHSLLIADSRLTDLNQHLPPDLQVQPLGYREALTQPNLGEFDEFRRVAFFGYQCDVQA